MSQHIVSARIYIGTGLQQPEGKGPAPGKYGRHRVVIDPVDVMRVVERIVNSHFIGSTIYKGRGQWGGLGEPSIVVEVWDEAAAAADFKKRVEATALELSEQIDQLSVAVVTSDKNGPTVQYLEPRSKRERRKGIRYVKKVA